MKRIEPTVIPANAGIQNRDIAMVSPWIPAFAGMTPRRELFAPALRTLPFK